MIGPVPQVLLDNRPEVIKQYELKHERWHLRKLLPFKMGTKLV